MAIVTDHQNKDKQKEEKPYRRSGNKKSNGLRVLALILALAMVAGLVVTFIQSMSW